MGQVHRELGLIDEHGDELWVARDVREHALDGDDALEASGSEGLRSPHLSHTADVYAVEQQILSEDSRLSN